MNLQRVTFVSFLCMISTMASGSDRPVAKPVAAPANLPAVVVPLIVARVALTGQTGPIPTTTLLTPQKDGLYRVSSYAVITVPNSTFGQWDFQLSWADESGPQVCANLAPCLLLQMYSDAVATDNLAGGPGTLGTAFAPNGVAVVRAKAGTPLTFAVAADPNGNPSGSTYDLFITVEQLM